MCRIPLRDEVGGLSLQRLEVESEEFLRVVLIEPGEVCAGGHEGVAEGDEGRQ